MVFANTTEIQNQVWAYKFRFTIKIITAEQNDTLHKLYTLYIKSILLTQIHLFVTECIDFLVTELVSNMITTL